jgi:hypothetical protein
MVLIDVCLTTSWQNETQIEKEAPAPERQAGSSGADRRTG